ncbi:hypothetical protein DCAR_0313404 [Daucus carota subsp. sativus]|uniref:PGG domain-containing protein n=1 Tax=Daucus carota subsp. sativus TaxID=79200 RepID=A0AAF1AVJ7_DAUCS|nr:hypothetical protein DCAR_0313404 [Daucus carota subsp. sativus]
MFFFVLIFVIHADGQRQKYNEICVPLNNAALKGDWPAAEKIIRQFPEVVRSSITQNEETVLHIMNDEDLELQNGDGSTALCLAVASTVEMVDVLLRRNKGLLKIRKKGDLPFLCAVYSGDRNMWNYSDKTRILDSCLAFGLLGKFETLSTQPLIFFFLLFVFLCECYYARPNHVMFVTVCVFVSVVFLIISILISVLIPGQRLPFAHHKAIEIVRIIWKEIVQQKHEDILKQIAGDPSIKKVEGLLFTAARLGNHKFIIELLRLCPDITWEIDENKHTIFHVAVIHRQENVYNLLYELGSKKLGVVDKDGNNILHLAAILPKQNRLNIVSGAAFQMQRELIWFQEVNTMVSSVDRTKKNNAGKSPQELFTDEHIKLMEKGENWMKQTAAHSMVVAALIATIMFAVAFTLPGGNNQNNGLPIYLGKRAFAVFVITDAISLCTSSASILVFLAILTARYTEKDFLVSLPVKLMIGVSTLFISIMTMMIAFSASFFLLYEESMKWAPILVTALASLPVFLFACLQFRLLLDMIQSTFKVWSKKLILKKLLLGVFWIRGFGLCQKKLMNQLFTKQFNEKHLIQSANQNI